MPASRNLAVRRCNSTHQRPASSPAMSPGLNAIGGRVHLQDSEFFLDSAILLALSPSRSKADRTSQGKHDKVRTPATLHPGSGKEGTVISHSECKHKSSRTKPTLQMWRQRHGHGSQFLQCKNQVRPGLSLHNFPPPVVSLNVLGEMRVFAWLSPKRKMRLVVNSSYEASKSRQNLAK